MSETMTPERKPSVNKNIKKLRTLSAVCNLAKSWQRWVSENEEKQASEPAGWTPDSIGKPQTEKKEPKKPVPTKSRTKPSQGNEKAPEESRIKTKQVVKTVTRDVQEKSAGIEFLTERICKDAKAEELDRMLKSKRSPTRRRKCANVVSELRQSWKTVENERKRAGDSSEDGGISEAKERILEREVPEKQDNEDENQTESSSLRIKRPSLG
ncbi:actin-binding Rho-activating protein, partial [Clarias magur]